MHSPAIAPLADVARKRFVINVSSNLGYVLLNTALMVWYVPFLVRHLGVAAYGMISLANALVAYAGILTTSLDVSISRFLAIDLNQGNDAGANRTFNTALWLSLAACGILLPPLGIVTYFFPLLFNVPPGLAFATQFLLASVGITTRLRFSAAASACRASSRIASICAISCGRRPPSAGLDWLRSVSCVGTRAFGMWPLDLSCPPVSVWRATS